jgi:LPXTG-motif cell wall-anchored protein
MDSNQDSRGAAAWLLASISSFVLVIGSVAFATPATADPSSQGQAHSASGQANRPEKAPRPGKAPRPEKAPAHGKPARSGASAVSLPRPNDFQAQSDPDGMTNGGVDQPGGLGGVDTTSQDGNNGSGNDTDCEDDNRGVGIPGHCKDRIGARILGAPGIPESDNPVVPTPEQPASPLVLTPGVPAVAPLASSDVAPAAMAAPRAVASVLPNTGLGQGTLSLGLAGLAALLVGGGLLRGSRRATS